jgi:lysozyme
MRTSARGIAQLEADEGVVLRAYRCPAGVWTIGAGLTAASGVVRPEAGMTITREEASRLLSLALERNYEPAVRAAMPGAARHEFDAGVSFHFNTGAIARASWVSAWRRGDWPAVERGILAWNRGGGRVLPGLVARRRREFALLRHGTYHVADPDALRPASLDESAAAGGAAARLALPLRASDAPRVAAALQRLGYGPATHPGGVSAAALRAFQRDHDLTVDGIAGRATAAALERALAGAPN